MNTAPSQIALPEVPEFTTLGETRDVREYVMSHEGAQQTGRKLGLGMAAKIREVFPEMKAGEVLVVANIVGVNLDSPVKYATPEDRLALFGGRFRREILFTVMHELVRADLDFSLVDSRGKKDPIRTPEERFVSPMIPAKSRDTHSVSRSRTSVA